MYYLNSNHVCIIGIGRPVLIPMITWEIIINIYLTALFLDPLRKLYSFRNKCKPGLQTMARRTFIGSIVSLLSTIVNLGVLSALNGEYAWLCLMLCNTDGEFVLLFFTSLLRALCSHRSSYERYDPPLGRPLRHRPHPHQQPGFRQPKTRYPPRSSQTNRHRNKTNRSPPRPNNT
jgi:hypothetical protein